MQPGVANVYCAVTQHSRNGATFYLENFPIMTGREYRLPPPLPPSVLPSVCPSTHLTYVLPSVFTFGLPCATSVGFLTAIFAVLTGSSASNRLHPSCKSHRS